MNIQTKKRRGLSRKAKRLLFIWGMLALPLLQWLVFFVYINIDSVVMSFRSMNFSRGEVEWTTQNYTRFFREMTDLPELPIAVRNSVLAGVNNLLLVLISMILAYFFYKKIPGRGIFRIIYFLPSVISIVVYTMVFQLMFDSKVGPINQLLMALGIEKLPQWFGSTQLAFPLILLYCLWVGTGYNIIIFGAAMENLPESVMEYSKLEGVGKTRELFQIVIPMIWPTLSVAILGCVTVMFTLFIQVELLLGDGAVGVHGQTVAFLVNNIVKGGTNLEYGAALGVCFTVIATPLVILLKKFLDKVGTKFGY